MRPPDSGAGNLAQQAAAWLVRLGSDDAQDRLQAQAGFAAWKARDPRHAAAAARIEAFLGQVQGLRQGPEATPAAAAAALQAAHAQRRSARRQRLARRVGSALVLAAVMALPAWVAVQTYPPTHLVADLRSQHSEWTTHTLADGSRLTLSGTSAVNLRFDAQQRVVELLRGSLLVDVAKDAQRPFYIETPVGRVRALGTRFAVRYGEAGLVVEMLESQVAVQNRAQWQAGSREAVVVGAGERLQLDAAGTATVERFEPQGVEQGWRQHQLVVQDRPLPEVLDQLARHHAGALRYDRAALADLRVSGVLPLDDTGRALRLLQRSFPTLRLRFLTDHLVWITRVPDTQAAAAGEDPSR